MAPVARYALLDRTPRPQINDRQPLSTWTNEGAVPTRDPKTMSKAERMLGVGDTSGMNHHKAMSNSSKRSSKSKSSKSKGFTSAFSDLKGVFSGGTSRNSSRGRRTPTSPPFHTATDTDSMTSGMTARTSPTFDLDSSTSTLPSNYEPPQSPYFVNRTGSSGASSLDEQLDSRHDYHAALNPLRYKPSYELDMPPISEVYDHANNANHEVPPLEMAPLSPDPPSTSSNRTTFLPVNRLRSPSSTSVASESTAKGKWMGWRYSKSMGKEVVCDYPSFSRNTEPIPRAELSAGTQHTAAVENWLARADLRRRPSQVSAMTKSPVPQSAASTFSPSSSTFSMRTLTSQKGAILAPNMPLMNSSQYHNGPGGSSMSPPLRTTPKADKANNIRGKDLLLNSVLSFSSSEDEGSDDELGRRNMPTKRISIIRGEIRPAESRTAFPDSPTLQTYSATQRIVQSKPQTKPRIINHSNKLTIVVPQKPALRTPKAAPSALRNTPSRPPFESVRWQASDPTELGSLLIDSAERVYPTWEYNPVESSSRRPISTGSSTLSPTSNIRTVFSKREEMLLASLRDGMDTSERGANEDSDSNSILSQNQIIPVSPPRQRGPKAIAAAEEMKTLDENKVINFPTPPANVSRSRSGSMVLSLSDSTLSDPLPPILLSPSMASRLSTNYSVSEYTITPARSRQNSEISEMPPLPSIPYELYGSVPPVNPASPSRPGRMGRKRSSASAASAASAASTNIVYMTGLEKGRQVEEEDGGDDDLTKYVLASCM